MKEPKPMQEIHEIRHKMQEEDKDLSWEQWVEKTRRIAHEAIQRYGLKVKRSDKAA